MTNTKRKYGNCDWLFRANRKQAKLPESSTAQRPLSGHKYAPVAGYPAEIRGLKLAR